MLYAWESVCHLCRMYSNDMFLISVTIFRSIIRDEIIPHAVLWFHGDLEEFHGDSEEDEGEMI